MDPSKENKDMFNSFFLIVYVLKNEGEQEAYVWLIIFFLKNMNNIKVIKFKEQ